VTLPFSGSHKIAALVASLHAAGSLITAAIVALEADSGQAILVWVPWVFIDFPISLLDVSFSAPLAFHAIAGSLWWYFLVLVFKSIASNWRRLPKSEIDRPDA
jgi:succinate dehydrogenase/fumarate reductase cytochrome b subunit